jgi:hypothetical protein
MFVTISSIGLAAVADASDLNGEFVSLIEEHAIVGNEAGSPSRET